ncbi:DUF4166 domain-containing protein [Paenibacillus xylaniclasticus]|uniref:DUF4166 domain-containing protein n=1 Tax=Paenibacillus xylaniclasticus TaxID=588083 RepID=UPI000FDC9B52|nr:MULTISPECIES: DUF4166 domain-containing protein [Paenibacillus]GFN31741.1 hypothetical protein PCURB6_20010 [Paenibacillus curdlanolyticus]
MASIYEQALGESYHRLHPRIRERFGFSSRDKIASIGTGIMNRVWHNRIVSLALRLGMTRHIMFPNSGRDIPFTIENYAFVDRYGRETVSWIRKFKFKRAIRHFDATMIYSSERQGIVDYLGNKQHLAVDLHISAAPNGGIRIVSGEQRFYEGPFGFRIPRLLTGTAEVIEWFDDAINRYRISVRVLNPIIGTVFRYEGTFEARMVDASAADIPIDVKPLREEARE